MIKICAISDMHGILDFDIKPCDILCICGDIVPLRVQSYHDGTLKWLAKTFVPWCEKQPCDKAFLIAGNHDWIAMNHPDDWEEMFEQYSSKQKTQLMSTLGNLLPLRTSINSSLQNDSFDKKKQKYINGGYSEVEVSQNYTWGAQEIYERGMKMLCFMAKRWNLKFESQQQMEELLHVDFIQEKKILPENLHKYLRVDADARLVSLCQKFIKMKFQKGEVNEGVFFKDQYVRFTTDAMSKIIPKEVEAESEWGTHDFYFYEFVCEDSSVRAQLAIYAAKTISEELRKTYINIHKKYKRFENLGDKDSFRKNFKAFYELPFETDPVEVDDCISEEDLFKVFEKLYSQLIVFEKDFITKIS